ncbi:hypothetical protein WDW86_10675 [Bdellovibrionota bacterium FG-2]
MTQLQTAPVSTLGKNQIRCYHCRLVFPKKDGRWFNWEQMQVNLCHKCDKATEKQPERTGKSS